MVIFLGTGPSKGLTADRSIQSSADVEHNQDDDHDIHEGLPQKLHTVFLAALAALYLTLVTD